MWWGNVKARQDERWNDLNGEINCLKTNRTCHGSKRHTYENGKVVVCESRQAQLSIWVIYRSSTYCLWFPVNSAGQQGSTNSSLNFDLLLQCRNYNLEPAIFSFILSHIRCEQLSQHERSGFHLWWEQIGGSFNFALSISPIFKFIPSVLI